MEKIVQIKRGKVIIFNTEVQRTGSHNDVDIIRNTFGAMNAEVESCINYSKADVKRKMNEGIYTLGQFLISITSTETIALWQIGHTDPAIKTADLSEYDYVAIVVGAHGSEDDFAETADGEHIYLFKMFLLPLFYNPTLRRKLKWLVTQTCRGDLDDLDLSTEGVFRSVQYDPRYYLISYSTTEGFASRRSVEYGSLFIKCLCQRIREDFIHADILTILKKVAEDVNNEVKKIANVCQKPCNQDNFGDAFSFSFFYN